ncbi:hypothetical protein [Pseudochryseolinea flava]|uniref:Uncharacterized protein n=1 Tax=Pseudochryseolinea flava TaxID=2059302 RepID=A0A364Y4S3_9BACT|nr:hypothetical protein [Pseudochryseolinea flava]RAW01749.1 hypothetical protein DQQ10_08870 [Pseudochryseolinea flava]
MKGISKLIIILCVIVAIIAGVVWYAYYRMLPEIVGKAIVQDSEPAVLPEVYKAKISKIKRPVNHATEKLIREMDSLDIPFAAIIRLIDETENRDVVKTIEALKEKNPQSPNAIFNIVKSNIPSTEFDLEILRKPFLKYATMERYQYGMRYIEKNQVIEQIDEMPYREIVKEVLIQKRADLDRKLKDAGGPRLD